MNKREEALRAILLQGLLPLFFYKDPEVSLEIVKTLYKAGVRTLEYTNRGEAALDNFTYLKSELRKECPGLQLGIGTIKSLKEANQFLIAGADYIVCPIVNSKVGDLVYEAGLLWIPGCFTPTEVFTAQQHHAALIKIFPANILGPSFISSIKELFPGQLFIPTGGVELESSNIKTWFDAGVCAVGMGSKLISKEILANQQYEQLYKLTIEALELVQQNRGLGKA